MKGVLKEFKEFVMRGNVVDLVAEEDCSTTGCRPVGTRVVKSVAM